MALQTSGEISIDDVRNELGVTGQLALGSSAVRDLFGIASGEIRLSDGYGASLAPQWQTDLTVASYDNVSFDVSSQEGAPYAVTFNSDGTKMFIAGGFSSSVHQYTLSTGFDLSTASYDNISFDVSSEDTPYKVDFNTDGTKMYMLGPSDSMYQYTLSTGFDLSTASYDNILFDVSSEASFPFGFAFNSDGTKMFVVGITSDSVHQYTLSIAFDISTASYDSVSFSVSSEEGNPRGVAFSNDGTIMYITGTSSDSVHQYTLSTGFDLSTASYDNISFDISSEGSAPVDIAFNSNGSKMYVVDASSDAVAQYSTA